MNAYKPTRTAGEGIQPLLDIIKSVADFFSVRTDALPLHFSRVTEKFDVVKRPYYKRWVLGPDSE